MQHTVHSCLPDNGHTWVIVFYDILHLNGFACEICRIYYGCPLVIASIEALEGFALLPVAEFRNASAKGKSLVSTKLWSLYLDDEGLIEFTLCESLYFVAVYAFRECCAIEVIHRGIILVYVWFTVSSAKVRIKILRLAFLRFIMREIESQSFASVIGLKNVFIAHLLIS
jgi:hypothetical protein